MPIVSTTEVKTYLQIESTDTTYDDLISAYIEPCLFDLFDYTKNYFHNNSVRLITSQFTFSTTGIIVVEGTNFSTYSFQTNDDIHVIDSKRNDGIYIAGTVSSATITISTAYSYGTTLKEETEEDIVTIVKIDVPVSLKPIIASMVKYRIDNYVGKPKSERLGDYSVTYGNSGGYPDSIMNSLNKYRLVGFV